MSRYSKLLDEVSEIPDADGVIRPLIGRKSDGKKVVKARAPLRKSMLVDWDRMMAKAQVAGGKVTIHEKGKTAEKVPAGSHPGMRLEGLRAELHEHVKAQEVSPEDLRGPLSEKLLRRLVAAAKANKIHLNAEDLDNLDRAFRSGNAIPAYLISRLR